MLLLLKTAGTLWAGAHLTRAQLRSEKEWKAYTSVKRMRGEARMGVRGDKCVQRKGRRKRGMGWKED